MEGSVSPASNRKRAREDETPSQRNKREKAAERQRRKRERDRAAGNGFILPNSQPPPPSMSGATTSQPPNESLADYMNSMGQPMQHQHQQQQQQQLDLTPEELARREKVRAAARERQRKHRRLVKDRKMRELGLDMGNEVPVPGMEELHYRPPPGPEAIFQLTGHDVPQQAAQAAAAAMAVGAGPNSGEPPFPQGQPHGGQTFATTLLLSFSCAPLLKQHLLRTLNMTNEELASLEPIIADAWDQWDQQRRMHYDPQQNANAAYEHGGPNGGPPPFPPPPPPTVGPSPFQAPAAAAAANGATTSSSTPSSSGSVQDAIDPHLSGADGSKRE